MSGQATKAGAKTRCIDGPSFGQHVRLLRKARGLTQEGLAQCAPLSADTIRRLEQGSFSPSLETIGKLCVGLNLQVSTLFAGFELSERNVDHELSDALAGLTDRQRDMLLSIIRALRDFATDPDESTQE